MALDAGTRFGPYEITGSLGAGGMGEVYRARDTKLGRDVAIKTLPAALAGDPDRLARFEREAQLLAALNHPHIATIHGLDEHDGTLYLAMELVEGVTLEKHLEAGALPVDDALQLALQIAEALEAAHAKGVVHRDLKPANVMLTGDGQVKVLDFGLAKAFSGPAGEASPAHSPALSPAMTQAGIVLGTAGYMSPEQATGQDTDQRADVWAFGVVLYEMLTGLPPFTGESVPHILADVLKTEPDWSRLPANLHPRLTHMLERCLAKKPRSRLHSIADARIEIEGVLEDPDGATPKRDAAATRQVGPLRLIGVAAAAIAVAAGAWFLRPTPAAAPPRGPVARFTVLLPAEQELTAAPVAMIGLSPDGTRIVYAADNRLFLRRLDEPEVRPIAGTETTFLGFGLGAGDPVFSPDGQSIAHLENQRGTFVIKRLAATGGTQVSLYQGEGAANFPHGISWPQAETILFANAEGIVRMPANGGAVEVIVPRNANERLFSPQLLPGGATVLFTSVPGEPGSPGGFDDAKIVVQTIHGDDRTVVWEGGSAASYLPPGHLVFAQGATLFAIAFDPAARAVRGGPVPLVADLRRSSNQFSDTANFAVSDTGTLVYMPAERTANVATSLSWVDRQGRAEPLPLRSDDYTLARVSPDGTRIALVVGAAYGTHMPPSTWIYDLTSQNLSLLTTDPATNDYPVWSADSRRIYFRGFRDNRFEVLRIDLETREMTVVAESAAGFLFLSPWSLAPGEEALTLINAQSAEDYDTATLSLADGKLTQLLFGEGTQNEPVIAPNGAWLADAETSVGGEREVNLRPFPAVSRTRIPVGSGSSPVFSRDGSELFFYDGSGIAAVDVSYEPTLRVGAPRRLVESNVYPGELEGRTWDPDPSGQRFLVVGNSATVSGEIDETQRPRIEVVLNWFTELERRVPTTAAP
jgi:eukaryotic-like serine/threonine-protein kinase